jgi:hypothetical protein
VSQDDLPDRLLTAVGYAVVALAALYFGSHLVVALWA